MSGCKQTVVAGFHFASSAIGSASFGNFGWQVVLNGCVTQPVYKRAGAILLYFTPRARDCSGNRTNARTMPPATKKMASDAIAAR